MAHFAHVTNNIVDDVQVIEQSVIDAKGGWYVNGEFAPREEWLKTSYNTHGGIHSYGGTPLRKNFAGIGFTYDPVRDAFIPPQPYPSWTLNEDTCLWESPVPMPEVDLNTNKIDWDETITNWVITPRN